jgi:hypothetical protein
MKKYVKYATYFFTGNSSAASVRAVGVPVTCPIEPSSAVIHGHSRARHYGADLRCRRLEDGLEDLLSSRSRVRVAVGALMSDSARASGSAGQVLV